MKVTLHCLVTWLLENWLYYYATTKCFAWLLDSCWIVVGQLLKFFIIFLVFAWWQMILLLPKNQTQSLNALNAQNALNTLNAQNTQKILMWFQLDYATEKCFALVTLLYFTEIELLNWVEPWIDWCYWLYVCKMECGDYATEKRFALVTFIDVYLMSFYLLNFYLMNFLLVGFFTWWNFLLIFY
jgi:hypothetical protein